MNLAAEWRRNCCSSVIQRLCTALVILQGSTRPLETAITDKPDQVLFCFQGHKCIPCPENWLQYGENCYHFSKEWKTWQESEAQCSALESRLLKIESKEELVKIFFFSLSNCTLCILLWPEQPFHPSTGAVCYGMRVLDQVAKTVHAPLEPLYL